MANPFAFLPAQLGTKVSTAAQQLMQPPATAAFPAPTKGPTTGSYYDPRSGKAANPLAMGFDSTGLNPMARPSTAPLQAPGNNLTNPGYGEQALEYTQNRLLEDPYAGAIQDQYQQAQNPSAGENYLNQNLGSLDGPGQGEQYWNQVQGQYMDPFAGEQFARQATQGMSPQGPASAFYGQAMGQYDDFANYQGGQNSQGQYGQTSASLANGSRGEQGLAGVAAGMAGKTNYTGANNAAGQYGQSANELAGGTAGEQGLGQLAGQYGNLGQYQGGNNALGQYQQNAASGPMAAQQFYNSVQGQMGTKGTYSDPNLAAGQYSQTQQAFGDLPIANFDPFYDRASQLATQNYNRQSAGRGVYGSSEALSGVGNVITDIEAQRANRSFDAEMQRAQEQRARQQLLGEQARQGDLSSLSAFGANLAGLETFGSLANQAGNQTLAQQTMLGNQARASDQTGLDAFNSNLAGVNTFANVNNMQGNLALDRTRTLGDLAKNADTSATDAFRANLEGSQTAANINNQLAGTELDRNRLLGDLANNADSQRTSAQNTRVSGLNALSNAASNADSAETNRYQATTSAMNNADRTALDRMNAGADVAFRTDDTNRANYTAGANAAQQAANIQSDRTRLGADIASTGSRNDLNRLDSFNNTAQGAEVQRQARQIAKLDSVRSLSQDLQNVIGQGLGNLIGGSQADYENWFQSEMMPKLTAAGYDQKKIDGLRQDIGTAVGAIKDAKK